MTDLKAGFVDRQYADFNTMAGKLPFISEGKAVFYAGDNRQNYDRAFKYAKNNNMKPISSTEGGAFLNQIKTRDTFGIDRDRKLWDSASRKFAAETKGEIKTFVAGADQQSTFRRIELPTLLNNKKVQTINGADRAKLDTFRRETYNRLRSQGLDKRTAANQAKTVTHRKVAVAEIRQDMNVARKKKDFSAFEDAKSRLGSLVKQHKLEQSEKSIVAVEKREQKRSEFRQEKSESLANLRKEKSVARDSGDRSKIIESRKKATEVVRDLRSKNAGHAQQKGQDQKNKVLHAEKLSGLRGEGKVQTKDGQKQGQDKVTQYAAQVKEGSFKSQFTNVQGKGAESVKTKRNETAQLVKDYSVKTINGYDRGRFEKIYDRAYNGAVKRGVDKDNAREAAQDRVSHVIAKVELVQERAQLKQKPVTDKVKEHFAKDASFKDHRVKDLQVQAARENRAYKGPPAKPPELRQVETTINVRGFQAMSNLETNAKRDSWTPSTYQAGVANTQSTLSNMRASDLTSYFSTSQTSAQSYGISYTPTRNSSGNKSAVQGEHTDSIGYSQGHSGRSMSH